MGNRNVYLCPNKVSCGDSILTVVGYLLVLCNFFMVLRPNIVAIVKSVGSHNSDMKEK